MTFQVVKTAQLEQIRKMCNDKGVDSSMFQTNGLDNGLIALALNAVRAGEDIMRVPKIAPEPVLDFTIRVNRSTRPRYPNWVRKLMHPELELAGPAEYDLSQVKQWLHDDQKRGFVQGHTIYKHLQKGDALSTCLNLQDGLAIRQKGIAVFHKLFAGEAVFLWGSVVQDRNGDLIVPSLAGLGVEVMVDWAWLGNNWRSFNPALRFCIPAGKTGR